MTFANSSLLRVESKYFPTSIETLIEQDLQKLQKANQEVVDDDGNADLEDDSDMEEEGNVEKPENAEGDVEKAEDEKVDGEKTDGEKTDGEETDGGKAEGDAEKEGIEGPPGSDDEDEDDYFDDEDSDPIILGVRIYTKGGVAVSVTGNVGGEDEDEEDGDLKKFTKERAKDKKKKD
jgi:hypothetical protein